MVSTAGLFIESCEAIVGTRCELWCRRGEDGYLNVPCGSGIEYSYPILSRGWRKRRLRKQFKEQAAA